jgi:hypothetical protein
VSGRSARLHFDAKRIASTIAANPAAIRPQRSFSAGGSHEAKPVRNPSRTGETGHEGVEGYSISWKVEPGSPIT